MISRSDLCDAPHSLSLAFENGSFPLQKGRLRIMPKRRSQRVRSGGARGRRCGKCLLLGPSIKKRVGLREREPSCLPRRIRKTPLTESESELPLRTKRRVKAKDGEGISSSLFELEATLKASHEMIEFICVCTTNVSYYRVALKGSSQVR